jgi:tetratricopeptide (TPR) repeat protein
MMTKKMIIIFLLTAALAGSITEAAGIKQKTAELEKKLPSLSGKAKINALNDLAYYYQYISVEKSMSRARQALDLSRAQKYLNGEATALNYIAMAHMKSGNFEKSIENAEKSLNVFKKLKGKNYVFESLNVIGIIYSHFGYYNKSLESFREALKLKGEKGIKKIRVAAVLGNIGVAYKYLGNVDKDMEFQLKALEIREEIGDEKRISISLSNIAHTYKNQQRYEKSLEYYRKALEINERLGNKSNMSIILESMAKVYNKLKQFEKSVECSRKSLGIKREVGNKVGICVSLNNIGNYYLVSKKYKKALEHHLEALKLAEEVGNKTYIYLFLISVGTTYTELKDYGNALKYFERNLKMHRENGDKPGTNLLISLSNLYSTKGDLKKALEYHRQYASRLTEDFNRLKGDQVADMQAKYETLKKEKEIETLKKDRQIRELELNRQTLFRNVSVIVAGLVLIIFLQFFRRYHYLFAFWKKRSYIGYYKLMDKIGSGGMGDIYKARNIKDKARTSTYAIKVLREEYNNDEKYKKRFKNEAAVIDQLQHPNIVKVMERGEHDGTLYIAMELLEGQTLADKLEKETRLPLKTALSIMIQMASAIVEIHKRGIIHRDLKPENIMVIESLDNEMQIKILDFGLARTQNLTRLTRSGMIMGTIFYVSPEQLTHSKVLSAGDVYSLGVIYYQLLTGKKPFRGDTVFDIARQIIKSEPPAIDALYPGIPSGLTELINQMMSKNPAQRPLANEMKERLEEIRASILLLEPRA